MGFFFECRSGAEEKDDNSNVRDLMKYCENSYRKIRARWKVVSVVELNRYFIRKAEKIFIWGCKRKWSTGKCNS